jgi:hypothetical protein
VSIVASFVAVIIGLASAGDRAVVQGVLNDHPDLAGLARSVEFRPKEQLYWNSVDPATGRRRMQGSFSAPAESHFDTLTVMIGTSAGPDGPTTGLGAAMLRGLVIHELCHLQGWIYARDTSEDYAHRCEATRK